jgi:hypothetical protein
MPDDGQWHLEWREVINLWTAWWHYVSWQAVQFMCGSLFMICQMLISSISHLFSVMVSEQYGILQNSEFLYDTYVKYGPPRKCQQKCWHKFYDGVPSKQFTVWWIHLEQRDYYQTKQEHAYWEVTWHRVQTWTYTYRKLLECQNLLQEWQHYCWSHPVKVGVWCAVSARKIVVPVFFLMKQSQQINTCREDSIFNTSCDLRIVTTSFQMSLAIRHAVSSAKFACSSPPVGHQLPWSAELWTHQVSKNPPCTWRKVHITDYSQNFFNGFFGFIFSYTEVMHFFTFLCLYFMTVVL